LEIWLTSASFWEKKDFLHFGATFVICVEQTGRIIHAKVTHGQFRHLHIKPKGMATKN